jgi:hypothetical protein
MEYMSELLCSSETLPPPAMPLFPDPALTANIYCSGLLDSVIFLAVAPFWQAFQRHDPAPACYLWLMRYGKGGEHLKVRVHGPESQCLLARGQLEERVTAFLSGLEQPAEPVAGEQREKAPPIDVEDATDHPDLSFLWTTYRRNPISFGGKPFLGDDRYAHLLTRCLASGCERLLALAPGANGLLPHALRQSTLLESLISGLAALDFSAAKRADYLAYHRDWLLRSTLSPSQRSENGPIEQICQYFDAQIARMKGSLLPFQKAAEDGWNGSRETRSEDGWRQSLADLLAHIASLCRDPDYHLDPFAGDPVFAPVFKVFHGLANQLGLKRTDEAFAHHLLFRIAAADRATL